MEVYKKVEVWKKVCGDNIAKTLLDNIVELTNGKWYSVLCVNYTRRVLQKICHRSP